MMYMQKKYLILTIALSILFLGVGCINNSQSPIPISSYNAVSEEIKTEPSKEDLLSFLFTYQKATEVLISEYEGFLIDSVDPKLKAMHATNNSDIPLMRYLGKKGQNDLKISDIEKTISTLKSSIIYSDFYGSIGSLENGVHFLTKFYENIETLQTFEEFKLFTADLSSSKEEMERISNIFEFEYNAFKNTYTDIDYKLTENLAWIIIEQNQVKSIVLNKMDSFFSNAPIKFTGNVSSNTQKIVVTAQYGGKTDVYTLENFNPGDTTFQYQAAEKWNNLAEGINSYEFVAYFKDGTTRSTAHTISYHAPSSTSSSVNPNPTYYYSPIENSNDDYDSCCKVCTTGKACGDSCISRSYTCHKGPGCACNGY